MALENVMRVDNGNIIGGGGGGTSDYTNLTNKPSINGVTLSGNKTTSDLGIDKNAVGLGNVPNVATNDQTPTFTQASTRNNIASGEKLSVILGKIQKFFNDLKTVAFTGSFSDLTNKPNAEDIMLSDGTTSVEEAVAKKGNVKMSKLWENPSPTASFAEQDINLSTSDYDMLLILVLFHPTVNRRISLIVDKGKDAYINCSGFSPTISIYTMYRTIAYASDTKYRAYGGFISTTTATADNERLIPYQIYGIKLL